MSEPSSVSPTPPPQSSSEDKQTLALIRRVLRPQSSQNTPLDELLPALTSSPAVDVQLYAFLAIICRDFIFAWYSKITNDRTFVDEVITVIAHLTRSLEQRLRQIDLEILLLDELPSLLDSHVRDYRQCIYRHKTSLCPHLSIEEIFHNFQPHPALKSSPESERIYLKLLSLGILAVLLPTEDLQSNCERTLIREILSDLVFWNVVDKLSEPWMLYEIITKLLPPPNPTLLATPGGESTDGAQQQHNEVFYSGEDDLSSLASTRDRLPKKRRKSRKESRSSPLSRDRHHRQPSVRTPPPPPPPQLALVPPSQFLQSLENVLNVFAYLITFAASFITTIFHFVNSPPPPPRRKKPILRMTFLKFIANLLRMDSRQPWLTGSLVLTLIPLTTRPAGSLVDSLLSSLFQTHLASPAFVINILSSARTALFPNGAMGPPRPMPSEKEKIQIREAAVKAVMGKVPKVVMRHYVGVGDGGRKEVEEILDVLSKKEVNKHLLYQILELIVVRLVPEVAVAEVDELLADRGLKM